jgi:hypothetical protein
MDISSYCRSALRKGAASSIAVMLSGCASQTQLPMGSAPSGVGAVGQALTQPSAHGDLLYVAHARSYSARHTVVSILTLPQGKPVATIAAGYLSGMCSDGSGNVWLVVWRAHPEGYYLDEYAHGGTKPIAQIRIPSGGFGNGCAVDPKSGDLAVMNPTGGSSEYRGSIDVWAGAREGKPAVYDVPFLPKNGAYDESGNLFVDGTPGGSDPWLLFGELVKGGSAVASVRIDKKTALPGGVQWDGKYIAVQTGGYHPYMRGNPRIYRIKMSGTSGRVVGVVIPRDPALRGTAWFAVYGDSVISITGSHKSKVEIWPYPAGSGEAHVIGRFNEVRGLTISLAR